MIIGAIVMIRFELKRDRGINDRTNINVIGSDLFFICLYSAFIGGVIFSVIISMYLL